MQKTDASRLKWLAVWYPGRKGRNARNPGGYKHACYEYEISNEIKREVKNGNNVAGPFDSGQEAVEYALERLRELIHAKKV